MPDPAPEADLYVSVPAAVLGGGRRFLPGLVTCHRALGLWWPLGTTAVG